MIFKFSKAFSVSLRKKIMHEEIRAEEKSAKFIRVNIA